MLQALRAPEQGGEDRRVGEQDISAARAARRHPEERIELPVPRGGERVLVLDAGHRVEVAVGVPAGVMAPDTVFLSTLCYSHRQWMAAKTRPCRTCKLLFGGCLSAASLRKQGASQ